MSKSKKPFPLEPAEALQSLSVQWSAIASARDKRFGNLLSERPAGSFTVAEYAERFGIIQDTARSQLASMVSAGDLQSAKVYLINPDGRRQATNVYWAKAR